MNFLENKKKLTEPQKQETDIYVSCISNKEKKLLVSYLQNIQRSSKPFPSSHFDSSHFMSQLSPPNTSPC